MFKPDIPLRSIENFTNSPSYALYINLNSESRPLQYKLHNLIKYSYEFKCETGINYLKEWNYDKLWYLV